jgi:hypothetical protein
MADRPITDSLVPIGRRHHPLMDGVQIGHVNGGEGDAGFLIFTRYHSLLLFNSMGRVINASAIYNAIITNMALYVKVTQGFQAFAAVG